MYSTLGVPARARMGAGQAATDSSTLRPIVPGKGAPSGYSRGPAAGLPPPFFPFPFLVAMPAAIGRPMERTIVTAPARRLPRCSAVHAGSRRRSELSCEKTPEVRVLTPGIGAALV